MAGEVKPISITINGVKLTTEGMSKSGIAWSSLNSDAQKLLSIFNKDNDKYMISRNEMENAIKFFQKYDTEGSADSAKKTNSPDGKLNQNELNKAKEELNKRIIKPFLDEIDRMLAMDPSKLDGEKIHNFISKMDWALMTDPTYVSFEGIIPEEMTKEELKELLINIKEDLSSNNYVSINFKSALQNIHKIQDRTEAAAKHDPPLKLKTRNPNIGYRTEGNKTIYYSYDPSTGKFKERPDIKKVDELGNYFIERKNNNNKNVKKEYTFDNIPLRLSVTGEKDPAKAAKEIGLTKSGDEYKDKLGNTFYWNEKTNAFINSKTDHNGEYMRILMAEKKRACAIPPDCFTP